VDLDATIAAIVHFRDDRDWAQFHSIRNLAAALSIEAAELQESLLWKTDAEVCAMLGSSKRDVVCMELADVLIYALLLSHTLGEDPLALVNKKLQLNAEKYPVHVAKGSARKYTDLE
jgi:NTP pyrophosphatase (non-canonical NTP hydrolase)